MLDLSTDIDAARRERVQHSYAPKAVHTAFKAEDGRMYAATVQDCTKIAEWCKAMHNEGFHGSGEMRHAARLPKVIVEKYCNERGISFEEFMAGEEHIKACAEHPDNAMFRIWKGRI